MTDESRHNQSQTGSDRSAESEEVNIRLQRELADREWLTHI